MPCQLWVAISSDVSAVILVSLHFLIKTLPFNALWRNTFQKNKKENNNADWKPFLLLLLNQSNIQCSREVQVQSIPTAPQERQREHKISKNHTTITHYLMLPTVQKRNTHLSYPQRVHTPSYFFWHIPRLCLGIVMWQNPRYLCSASLAHNNKLTFLSPQIWLTVIFPLREFASSITSSWTRLAVWIISAIMATERWLACTSLK